MNPSWVVMSGLHMDFRRQQRTFIDMDPAVLQETPQPNPEMNPEETSYISNTTCNGSAAEMYIKSFLPSIGDVDVTRFRNNEIADFGDTPSVRDMHGMHEVIDLFKLEHWPQCPGYVCLVWDGKFRYVPERNGYVHIPSQLKAKLDRLIQCTKLDLVRQQRLTNQPHLNCRNGCTIVKNLC